MKGIKNCLIKVFDRQKRKMTTTKLDVEAPVPKFKNITGLPETVQQLLFQKFHDFHNGHILFQSNSFVCTNCDKFVYTWRQIHQVYSDKLTD